MNFPALGQVLVLEALSGELEDLKTPSAICRDVVAQSPACLGRGMCCAKGRAIPCDDIHPHKDGLVIERDGIYLLNGTLVLNDFKPEPKEQIEIVRDTEGRKVLGWIIPERITEAVKHPLGALLIKERSALSDFRGMSVSLLILPTTN